MSRRMTISEQQTADQLLSQIETAIGEVAERDGRNAALLKTVIESVNGLRSLLGVVRAH
jgi:hypothetical protein